jgi:tryptophan synthase alpha chain
MGAFMSEAPVHDERRIACRFAALKQQGRKALIPYITAGHPSAAMTVELMHALVRGGADVIELGVPFSDPMADGPAIQRAAECAIRNGVGIPEIFAMVREFRSTDHNTPVVLMGYANPIERIGSERFAELAAAVGVDGVLVVDYPPEEAAAFVTLLDQHKLDTIFLLAPTTTSERLDLIAAHASGYLYYVSLTGVTGAAHLDAAQVSARLTGLRERFSLPLVVGFGIRDGISARAVSSHADGVVIGSKMITEIETCPAGEQVLAIERLVRSFRSALDFEEHKESV